MLSATSFFYESESSQLYLITNWHVVTNRDPSRPSHSKTGAVPCELRIKLHNKQKTIDRKGNIVTSDVSEVRIPINTKDGNCPTWFEHPEHGYKVDVVGIELKNSAEYREKYEFTIVNKWKEYQENYEPEAMDDVFVIGYPWGLSATAKRGDGIPIYKKGCIASDPIIDFQRLPCVLVDCRTTSGLSGSPVIASRSGLYNPDGEFSGNSVIGTVSMFLGIYSGRLTGIESHKKDGDSISEIGIVWKASVLGAITQRGAIGTPISDLT